MTAIFARRALLPDGWRENVRLDIDLGRIAGVWIGEDPRPRDECYETIVPGMGNLHSHAFQRAMAGLAERRGHTADSFWSWRETMYHFALSMTPEQVEAVAAQLYVEMLEAGYTRVGEFHYLHHGPDGRPYADIAEMAQRVCAASASTGIGMTLLPVFYAHSGFGGAVPDEGQRRFINAPDRYGRLLEACRAIVKGLPGGVLGIAPHSLRAATLEDLEQVLPLVGDGPIHIHISEQLKEVSDCVAWSGLRPVEWLLENQEINDRWCLIHATHMTDDEAAGVARSGAVVGLCPITEANLGDGIFDAARFLEAGGHFGVGSDSNVDVTLSGELKQLEYSQRLGLRARNVIAQAGGSTGEELFTRAEKGAARVLGATRDTVSGLQLGADADLVAIETDEVPYLTTGNLLDHFVFARGTKVGDVWARGQKVVSGGVHLDRQRIAARFSEAMSELTAV